MWREGRGLELEDFRPTVYAHLLRKLNPLTDLTLHLLPYSGLEIKFYIYLPEWAYTRQLVVATPSFYLPRACGQALITSPDTEFLSRDYYLVSARPIISWAGLVGIYLSCINVHMLHLLNVRNLSNTFQRLEISLKIGGNHGNISASFTIKGNM